jgi:hypothetical protein
MLTEAYEAALKLSTDNDKYILTYDKWEAKMDISRL